MTETRRERKKRETRDRITAAALRLFLEQGYDETTVAGIAAAADVDAKTFFNYFPTKADVLLDERDLEADVLLDAIASARPDESPGQVLQRAVREYAVHRRPQTPFRDAAQVSAISRLVLTTPDLQAKGARLQLRLQGQVANQLLAAFPDLDPITAAAMTGAVLGALQQASTACAQLGRTQEELWQAAEHALTIASNGILGEF